MIPYPEIELLHKLGEGAYGAVYQARVITTGETVAVKTIKIAADEEGVSSTTLREMTILQSLNHPNIVKLLSQRIDYKSVEPKAQLIFEFMDQDLSKRLRGSKKPNPTEVKNIMRQILQGVQYMHKNKVFHRDLKPHNILISHAGTVKIADFGLSRILGEYLQTMSKEIQTLWYRAPELLLGTTKYDLSVDMWSLGCIFYELSEYKVLFQTESQIGQVMQIFRQCGTPHLCQWSKITLLPNFKPTFPKFIAAQRTYKNLSVEGVDLLERMIMVNPEQRITVNEALEHIYFKT